MRKEGSDQRGSSQNIPGEDVPTAEAENIIPRIRLLNASFRGQEALWGEDFGICVYFGVFGELPMIHQYEGQPREYRKTETKSAVRSALRESG